MAARPRAGPGGGAADQQSDSTETSDASRMGNRGLLSSVIEVGGDIYGCCLLERSLVVWIADAPVTAPPLP